MSYNAVGKLTCKLTGKGDVHVAGIGTIKGVLLVPEIPYNILAAMKISEEMELEVIFSEGRGTVQKGGIVSETVVIQKGLPFFHPLEPDNQPKGELPSERSENR